jgi:hypothetical protein
MKIQKLGVAAAVGLALTGTSMVSNAVILGVPGEALLVPVFMHGDEQVDETIVRITTPSNVGIEAIPNFFTATSTTPTDPRGYFINYDPKSSKNEKHIRWYWYDYKSKHGYDEDDVLTPDDVLTLTASDLEIPAGEAGYLVVTNWVADIDTDAQFPLYGEAALVMNDCRTGTSDQDIVPIPVLAMTDQADQGPSAPGQLVDPYLPTRADNVKYDTNYPNAVSPLLTGTRTGRSDGLTGQFTMFDLTFGERGTGPGALCDFPNTGTWHVVWLDENVGWDSSAVSNIFDSEENQRSITTKLPKELNFIPVDITNSMVPGGASPNMDGFIRYRLDEYRDSAWNEAETSGVFFSLVQIDRGDWVTSLSQELGTFCDGKGTCKTPAP